MKKFLLVPPFPSWNGYINHKFKNEESDSLHVEQINQTREVA